MYSRANTNTNTKATHLLVLALHHERRVQLEREIEGLRLLEEAVVQHDDLAERGRGRGTGTGVKGMLSDEMR